MSETELRESLGELPRYDTYKLHGRARDYGCEPSRRKESGAFSIGVCPVCHSRGNGDDDSALWFMPSQGFLTGDGFCGCAHDDIHRALDADEFVLSIGGEDGETYVSGKIRLLDVPKMLHTPPPPPEWLAEPFLARGVLTMIFGREGQGKSLVAMALTIALASGDAVGDIPTRRSRVLYLDAENGEYEIHRRLKALGMTEEHADRLAVGELRGLDLRRDLQEVEDLVQEVAPDVLVLDSFRSIWGGDENDTREAGGVLDPLRNLVRDLGCAGLILHHSGKAGAEYRGTTAIGGACEVMWRLGRIADDDDTRRRELRCTKMRIAPEPDPVGRYLRIRAEKGLALVESAEPPAAEAPPGRPSSVRALLHPIIERTLQRAEVPLTRAEVARAVERNPRDRSVGRILSVLEDDGTVVRLDDGRFLWTREYDPVEGGGNTPPTPRGSSSFATTAEAHGDGGLRGGKTLVADEGFATRPDADGDPARIDTDCVLAAEAGDA